MLADPPRATQTDFEAALAKTLKTACLAAQLRRRWKQWPTCSRC